MKSLHHLTVSVLAVALATLMAALAPGTAASASSPAPASASAAASNGSGPRHVPFSSRTCGRGHGDPRRHGQPDAGELLEHPRARGRARSCVTRA